MTNDELQYATEKWHRDRKITINGNVISQLSKLVEEVGELAQGINKKDNNLIVDSIGDCIVVLSAIANLVNTSINDCWYAAYNEIKDRKGILTKEGLFIKEEDLDGKNVD